MRCRTPLSSSCLKYVPIAKSNASVSRIIFLCRSNIAKIDVVVNLFFSSTNASAAALVHSNFCSFLMRSIRGLTTFK
jgi:hypothetical protein